MLDLIFHILNTAALCAAVYYLFNRYVSVQLSHFIAADQAHHSNLFKRHDLLKKQEQGLVRAYYHQNYRYEELSHKVEIWKQRAEAALQERMREGDAITQLLDQREQDLYIALKSYYFCDRIVPRVLTESEVLLRTFFATGSNKAHYGSKVIAHLKGK